LDLTTSASSRYKYQALAQALWVATSTAEVARARARSLQVPSPCTGIVGSVKHLKFFTELHVTSTKPLHRHCGSTSRKAGYGALLKPLFREVLV
jgi:hypothetical protein